MPIVGYIRAYSRLYIVGYIRACSRLYIVGYIGAYTVHVCIVCSVTALFLQKPSTRAKIYNYTQMYAPCTYIQIHGNTYIYMYIHARTYIWSVGHPEIAQSSQSCSCNLHVKIGQIDEQHGPLEMSIALKGLNGGGGG